MTMMVVARRQVGRQDTNFDEATGWGVEMPIGGQIIHAQWDGEGIMLETFEPASMPVFAHKLILVRAFVGFTPFLGHTAEFLTSFIAPIGPPKPGSKIPTTIKLYLFKHGPWPTSALDAMATKGSG